MSGATALPHDDEMPAHRQATGPVEGHAAVDRHRASQSPSRCAAFAMAWRVSWRMVGRASPLVGMISGYLFMKAAPDQSPGHHSTLSPLPQHAQRCRFLMQNGCEMLRFGCCRMHRGSMAVGCRFVSPEPCSNRSRWLGGQGPGGTFTRDRLVPNP